MATTSGAPAAFAFALACGACAIPPRADPSHTGAFSIAVLGDMPYVTSDTVRESVLREYAVVLRDIDAAPVAFVVHIGDVAYGGQCSDSLYATRVAEFNRVRHPLVYTYGDNEWADCGSAGFDPLERLRKLRATFAADSFSLGAARMRLTRQSPSFPENARWSRGGVEFITVHAIGSNNNWGPHATPSEEFVARNAANIAWVRGAFERAHAQGSLGLAIFLQANPFPDTPAIRGGARREPDGHRELVGEIQRLAKEFGRPVAIVHGDTHFFRVDKPLGDRATRKILLNVTRAETFGDPNSHWLLMTVDARDPNLFSFSPRVAAGR